MRGCVALQRGPVVYCLEQRDQPAELLVDDVSIDLQAPVEIVTQNDGTVTLTGHGSSGATRGWAGELYRPAAALAAPSATPARWVATPYYRWANRGVSPMRVWLPSAAGTGKG